MKNIDVKKLAQITSESGVNKKLSDFVMNELSRKQLIAYVRHLKMLTQKNTVKIFSSSPLSNDVKKSIENKFAGKSIVYELQNIGDGICAQINDTIIDLTLSGYLNQTIEELKSGI